MTKTILSRRAAAAAIVAAPALIVPAARAAASGGAKLSSPATLPPPNGYSHLAESQGGKTVYIAGQVPHDINGNLVGENNFRLQVEQVFRNLDTAVREAGGTFHDIIKLNYYCISSVPRPEIRAVPETRDKYVNTAKPPVSTFVYVDALVRPSWLIEIEAVAIIGSNKSAEHKGSLGVVAQLDFDPKHAAFAAAAVGKLAAATRMEPGCLSYVPSIDIDVPGRIHLAESWVSAEALDAHFKTPHMEAFRKEVAGKLQKTTAQRFAMGEMSDLFPRRG